MNGELVNAWVNAALALVAAPLLPGIINRVKAIIAGRRGQPLLQTYYDCWRLIRKGAVYSSSTTWVFRLFPVGGFACICAALLLAPFGGTSAPVAFGGDLIVFVYLLAMIRFLMVLAALDTASSFEGMGGSREVLFSALAEPALLLCLATVARTSQSLSLSSMFVRTAPVSPELLIVAISMAIVYLCENARCRLTIPTRTLNSP